MYKLRKLLFSTRTMTVLLVVFALAMAVATFVENEYDTATAKVLIYNAKWFEILMLWLIVLFALNIKTYQLTRRKKWPILIFHVAFILMFLGGCVTRYVSFEGLMPIKEGTKTNEIISDKTYFKLTITRGGKSLQYDKNPYQLSYLDRKKTPWPFKKTFTQNYHFEDKTIVLKTLDYIPLAKDSLIKTQSGKNMLRIVSATEKSQQNNYISEGEIKNIAGVVFSYNKPLQNAVQVTEKEGVIMISLPLKGHYFTMEGQQKDEIVSKELFEKQAGTLSANQFVPLNHKALYTVNNINFVIPQRPFKGKVRYYQAEKSQDANNLLSAIKVALSSGQERDTLVIRGGKGVTQQSAITQIDGMNVSLGFGSKIVKTDFYVRCDDFLLERYPGSKNPASYESQITLLDQNKEEKHHIYMNNVLDYHGYRFFQASYFPDESGTILSVNADKWGTTITYIGYVLLFLGMGLTLFWKGSRFWYLHTTLNKLRKKKQLLLASLIFATCGSSLVAAQNSMETPKDNTVFAQKNPKPSTHFINPKELAGSHTVAPEHIKKLGRVLVQDFEGRIKPLNTLTLELLRKLYKKDTYKEKDHTISSDEWFLTMQIDPAFWANKPLLKVDHKGGPKFLKDTQANPNGYTSYTKLVDPQTGAYIFEKEVETAFNKPKSKQSNYDKALISLTERFNIFSNIAFGYYTRVIPIQNDPTQTWRSWIYSSQTDAVAIDHSAFALLNPYFNSVKEGLKTQNWASANQALETIASYQQTWGKKVIPANLKIELELLYNRTNSFFWLMIAYSLLGFLLVILGFAEVFSAVSKQTKGIRRMTKMLLGIMVVALLLHTLALGVRWYVSGHAPWSNGYEAIVFISGVGVLSGLLLYKNQNAFIPAAGALVAMIMMGFAHGGSMLDPQITPLEPVLKSYWLMIHVGIITSSYAFFGLAAVLSALVLALFSVNATPKTTHAIKELTLVNEMALTVGVFTLTIGTFLGGMWANESWGRYWSWDPKETWAFISIIFYAVVLHLRLVPKLRGTFVFNIASLWAIWTIIFTYFGVNYYLTGLHSYAAGDPIPIPTWIYVAIMAMLALSLIAYYKSTRIKNDPR